MDKPEFVPPRCPAEYIARKIKTHDELRLEALETAMAEVFSWTWTAAQSQPAAEPVGDEVELIARALCPNGADEIVQGGDVVGETIDMPAWMLYLPEARRVISALSTPAREVPDSEVPSWRFGNGMLAGKIDGDELANHLRDHNMKIVYREGPK